MNVMFKSTGKIILTVVLLIVALFFIFGVFTIVEPTEVAVVKRIGTINRTLERGSGVNMKWPFIESVTTIDLTPQQLEMTFSVDDDGAISKDLQTIGMSSVVIYTFKENDVINFVSNYTYSSLEKMLRTNMKSTLKEIIGKYSIYDLTSATEMISKEVWAAMNQKCMHMPLIITQLNVNNWDWSDAFDRQIAETMARTQQEKTAKADVAVAQAQAQKQIAEARAKFTADSINAATAKQVAITKSLGELEAAKNNAEAKRIAADAQAYENMKIAQNMEMMRKQWAHEEEMARLEKWNGIEPGSSATQYIVTPNYSALSSHTAK